MVGFTGMFPSRQSLCKLSPPSWLYKSNCLVAVPKLLKGFRFKGEKLPPPPCSPLLPTPSPLPSPPQKKRQRARKKKVCFLTQPFPMSSSEPDYTQLNQPEGKWFGLGFFCQRPGACSRKTGTKSLSQIFLSNSKMGQNLDVLYWSCYIKHTVCYPSAVPVKLPVWLSSFHAMMDNCFWAVSLP